MVHMTEMIWRSLISDQINGLPVLILMVTVGLSLIMCLMRVVDHVGMVMTWVVGRNEIQLASTLQ